MLLGAKGQRFSVRVAQCFNSPVGHEWIVLADVIDVDDESGLGASDTRARRSAQRVAAHCSPRLPTPQLALTWPLRSMEATRCWYTPSAT